VRISTIKLSSFRNFAKKELLFLDGVNVIVGPNASGKTNILEAIHLLSTGKSFRAGVEGEMVSHSAEIARIAGKVDSGKMSAIGLEVVLSRGKIEIDKEKIQKIPKKRLLVNNVARRLIDFAGNFKTVLFGPWDMDLVNGPPALRRNFLDSVLSQVDREYRRSTLSYEKGLRQRNKILWDLREVSGFGEVGRERLHFWDKLLIKNGNYLGERRQEFVDFCNREIKSQQLMSNGFSLQYDKSAISEGRLEEYEKQEVAAAQTLVGPHRDNFTFRVKEQGSKRAGERNLATYGSRGETRMGILWLKMQELNFIKEKTLVNPVLLLDDIFSELDHEHRDAVMGILKEHQTPLRQGYVGQAIITTADEHFVENLPQSSIINLK